MNILGGMGRVTTDEWPFWLMMLCHAVQSLCPQLFRNVSKLRLSGSVTNILLVFDSSFIAHTVEITWGGVTSLPYKDRDTYSFLQPP